MLKNSELFSFGFTFISRPSDHIVIWFPEDLFHQKGVALCRDYSVSQVRCYHLLQNNTLTCGFRSILWLWGIEACRLTTTVRKSCKNKFLVFEVFITLVINHLCN